MLPTPKYRYVPSHQDLVPISTNRLYPINSINQRPGVILKCPLPCPLDRMPNPVHHQFIRLFFYSKLTIVAPSQSHCLVSFPLFSLNAASPHQLRVLTSHSPTPSKLTSGLIKPWKQLSLTSPATSMSLNQWTFLISPLTRPWPLLLKAFPWFLGLCILLVSLLPPSGFLPGSPSSQAFQSWISSRLSFGPRVLLLSFWTSSSAKCMPQPL